MDASFPNTKPPPPDGAQSKHRISIALYLLLTLITFGLFNLYWNCRQMATCNDLLGRKDFSFWFWLVFSILTFGIYHIFYQYKMGSAIVELQHRFGKEAFKELPLISVLVTITGLSVVVDCIHQHEINKLVV